MTSTDTALVDEEAVAAFLANNNDFFARRPELLPSLETSPASDGVVSLADRQVAALRERNEALRKRLDTLIANARHNETTFERMRRLILALMDADSVADLNTCLAEQLVGDFELDDETLFLRDWQGPDLPHVTGVGGEAPVGSEVPWPRMFDGEGPSGEACRPEQYRALFPNSAVDGPASVALLPLGKTATLAFGSTDPQRFTSAMGDVFLHFLAAVLMRTLTRLQIG